MKTMSAARFIADLFETGQVLVPVPTSDDVASDDEQLRSLLRDVEAVRRESMAEGAPDFDLPVALWATVLFYRVCQLLVCRDLGATAVQAAFAEPCPSARCPSTDYSADLLFQFLPDLTKLVHGLASGDPLFTELQRLATEWPLSSVGIKDLPAVSTATFIENRSMRQLYLDRILKHNDTSRLGDPRVDGAARDCLGAYPQVNPVVAKYLALVT